MTDNARGTHASLRAVVLGYWLYTAFAAAWLLGNWGGEAATEGFAAWSAVLPPFATLLFITALLRSGRVSGRRRLAWLVYGAGSVMETIGSAIWAALATSQADTYGTWADAFFLCYYPLAAAACVLFFLDLGGSLRAQRVWIDVATLTIGFGGTLWFIVFGPLSAAAVPSPAGWSTTTAYAAGNALLITAAALVFTQVVDWRAERAMQFVLASIISTLVSDLWWIAAEIRDAYVVGALIDIGYYFDYAFIACALYCEFRRQPRAAAPQAQQGNAYSFLPMLAVLLALVVLLQYGVGTTRANSPALSILVFVGTMLLVYRQISVRREMTALQEQLAMRRADERLTELVRRSVDVFLIVDERGRLAYVSPASQQVLGRAPDVLVGRSVAEVLGADREPRVAAFLDQLATGAHAQAEVELEIVLSEDERRTVLVVGTNQSTVPSIRGIALTLHDMTDRKRLEEQLRALAFYDPLTLLANRTLFADRVHHAMSRMSDGLTPAVVFIDLDNFKTVNDSMGHSAGDRLLRTCAQRIVQSTRAGDTVARLGGDEFAVLIDHTVNADAALAVARHVLASLDAPMEVDGRSLRVTASLGVALAGHGTTSEHLLRNADAAMYSAKSAGKSRVVLFSPEILTAVRRRLQVEEELIAALARGDFRLYYQPIVDLRTGHLVGIEALLRWKHPLRGLISPAEFIPIAEDTGLIVPITQWALRRACVDAVELQGQIARGEGLRVAVNVSGRHVQGGDLVNDVREALECSQLAPECLVLEVTETLLLHESHDVEQRLARLKALGVRLALDDFGTGYSSLAYLHRFPVDILKIDRSFVHRLRAGAGDDAESASALAKAILSLAEALDLDTVAEGVEECEQRDTLLALGCQTGQGYWYGRPMPVAELLGTPAVHRRGLLAQNLQGPVDFSPTGRFRTIKPPPEDMDKSA